MSEIDFKFEYEAVGKCPLCRSGNRAEHLSVPMPLGGTGKFMLCADCELVYLDPAPTGRSLREFYERVYTTEEYRKLEGFRIPDPADEMVITYIETEKKFNFIEDHTRPPGRYLDIGCAYGNMLLEGGARGWDAVGIEPFSTAVNFCREKLGLHVEQCGILDSGLPRASLDLITMYEVIEHVEKPVQVMRHVAKLAKPGATLVMTTPNPLSPLVRIINENWIGWKPPTHLCLFSYDSLRYLLKRTGWEPVRLKASGTYPGQLLAVAKRAGAS